MMDMGAIVKSIKKPLPFYSGYPGPVLVDDNLTAERSAKLMERLVAYTGLLTIDHTDAGAGAIRYSTAHKRGIK